MATTTINASLSDKENGNNLTGAVPPNTKTEAGDKAKAPVYESKISQPAKTVSILSSNPRTFELKKVLVPLGILLIGGALLALVYFLLINKNVSFSPLPGKSDGTGGDGSGMTDKNEMFENPINGMLFSQSDAESFKDKKPVAVMVNNYEAARPSSGLSKADVIYEVVAESGITRLMPIFYSRTPETISSIRSARYYFVELAAGYKAHYIHWGAAFVPACQKAPITSSGYCPPVGGKVETDPKVDAYDWIVKMGLPNLDGGNYSCDGPNCAFGRDPNKVGKIPVEHTAFARFPLLYKLAREVRPQDSWHAYIPVAKWEFKDDAPESERGDVGLAAPISYNYWDLPAFAVKWVYDKENNEYIRSQGGVKQIDAENNQELRAKDVIVRFTKQESVGDKKNHLFVDLVGTGDALIFQDGKVIKSTWTRTNPDERDLYTDENKDPVKFVRGQIWIQIVPPENAISYGQTVPAGN
ncbi:hypothetical protein A2982_01775 [candidate division WWE3 bacterium RIFCSPLOWO2_01_FULL_39_13]|uniref:DUF3048 domain-containing protein n=1 Tax=candidate division WWE3 bacterium RIFCSPLOWO2_01_FULL_39_13 TaxID=1802624 RepID=A0A1F4V4P8_UNCKA|nr:MAG: hypothetical protein A2982_01775 [candidate division WWE3 bacterium RIFCSPLOWO2_01_FULL_39_13]